MKKTTSLHTTVIDRRRLITPLVVVAFCVNALAGSLAATAGGQPSKPFTPTPLIASEATELNRLPPRLTEFINLATRLETQARVERADLDNLRRQAEALKSQLPNAQRQLSSAITKLRDAGLWNAELDAHVMDRLQRSGDNELLNTVRAAGGPRAFLQRAPSVFPQVASEIDKEVRELAPKAAWQRVIEPLIGEPVHAWLIREIVEGAKTVGLFFLILCHMTICS